MSNTVETELVVLGSGPGGYAAAFRAADLGKKVVLIERFETIGGVCLNVGCIPSKALLHVAQVIDEAQAMSAHGVDFGKPNIDAKKIAAWKDSVVKKLTGGLAGMAKMRKVQVVTGYGEFTSEHEISVKDDAGKETTVKFENAIIAVGSEPVRLPFIPEDPRVMTSTGALRLEEPQAKMLILGGGIIGMEMACVYSTLGAEISIVEMLPQLIAGADKDMVAPFAKQMQKRAKNIYLETKVTAVEAKKDGLYVTFEGKNAPPQPERYDRLLMSVGRIPNGKKIAAEKAGVNVSDRGFIEVDKQMRTNVPHIFAIGDVIGNPMLAHKATHEGRLAAEVVAGKKHFADFKVIPSVAYTHPELAWVGHTEAEAKEAGINYGTGVFPWMASGRALAMGDSSGLTKMIFDKDTGKVIGGAMTGPNAGELIAEVALAIEMGCDAEDIALTIHPHPTLSETVALATEVFEKTATDLPPQK